MRMRERSLAACCNFGGELCLEQVVATLLVIEFSGFVLMLRSKFTCILGSNYVFFLIYFSLKLINQFFRIKGLCRC